MNTMTGYTVNRELENSGRVLKSLMLLARDFFIPGNSGVRHSLGRHSNQVLSNVPPRVWRRHSALISLLVQQAESSRVQIKESE